MTTDSLLRHTLQTLWPADIPPPASKLLMWVNYSTRSKIWPCLVSASGSDCYCNIVPAVQGTMCRVCLSVCLSRPVVLPAAAAGACSACCADLLLLHCMPRHRNCRPMPPVPRIISSSLLGAQNHSTREVICVLPSMQVSCLMRLLSFRRKGTWSCMSRAEKK